jgi:hypothetical protein
MKLNEIKANPDNPRIIKDERFDKLVKSIEEFPKMMELRPMVIDNQNMVLGGNMRLRALQFLGFKEIPHTWVKRADMLTEEERKRFIIADNVGFGDNDWEALNSDWDTDLLEDWGMEMPEGNAELDNYSDETENIQVEKAKELDFYDEFVIIRFKDEKQYSDFIIKNNVPQVQTSNMKEGKDIRTNFKKVFDYEDLYPVIE